MRVFDSPAALASCVGETLGASDWLTVDQRRIDLFAEATDDHQWIHVDPTRAEGGPFGRTIAHGYLTLSLLPHLVAQIYRVDGVRMAINYGLNRARFPHPVPVGSRVRASSRLAAADIVDGGIQAVLVSTVEIDGVSKPACVADTVTRYYALTSS
ncbi:MaoC family dehydratase [Phytohabitans kaempferiae]|uniref:MaoC family dehydratase n=1 Tax=Phytohabitans kaempferiae TaxID=1620943 RepID=A0ABV6LY40_9ACTN